MSTTPTERRLAITPGPVTVDLRTGRYKLVGGDGDIFATFDRAEDAEACADAHNTYNACGLTPSELLAKYQEAKILLAAIAKRADHGIPYYAYGDSEAGTYLSGYLSDIERMCMRFLNLPQ